MLAAGSAGATGQPVDWQCSKCPFPRGAQLATTAGAGYQSEDSFSFGDYTGLDREGTFAVGDFTAGYFGDDALRWQAEGRNLGLDSRRIDVQGGRQGRFDLRFGFVEIPRRLFENSQTVYVNPGSDAQTLPAGWVRAPGTSGMSELDAGSRSAKVDWNRESWNAGLSFWQSPHLRYDLDYRHVERNGGQLTGGSFLTAATSLLRPLDDETDTLEGGVSYQADTWTARVGYFGSFYSNGHDQLDWQNAFTAPTPGADNGSMALEPDNQYQQLMVSADYRGWERTRVSGRIAAGRMEQDQRVPPYTVNPLLAGGALPRDRYDGQVDTLHADLRLSSRVSSRLRLRGELVYDERNDDTPQDTWNYIVTDSLPANQPGTNLPYGYQRFRMTVSGSYRLPLGASGQLGYEFDNFQRDETNIDKTEQNKVWAELGLSPIGSTQLRLRYSYATRDGNQYEPVPSVQPPENPLLRTYNLANRDRESLEITLAAQPLTALDIRLSALVAEDDYDDTALGLTEAEYRNLSIDAGLHIRQDATLTGQVGYDEYQTTQFGSQSFSTPNWSADEQDESWIAGLSLDLANLFGGAHARVAYTYIDTRGEIRNDTSGLSSSFPDLKTTRHRLEAELRYPLRDNVDVRLRYLVEEYDVADWSLDGVAQDTVNNFLATGANWQGYDVNLVTLSVTWRLDKSQQQAGP